MGHQEAVIPNTGLVSNRGDCDRDVPRPKLKGNSSVRSFECPLEQLSGSGASANGGTGQTMDFGGDAPVQNTLNFRSGPKAGDTVMYRPIPIHRVRRGCRRSETNRHGVAPTGF